MLYLIAEKFGIPINYTGENPDYVIFKEGAISPIATIVLSRNTLKLPKLGFLERMLNMVETKPINIGPFKPEEYPRMLVWDDVEECAEERIVLCNFTDNYNYPVITVTDDTEKEFLTYKEYSTTNYRNCKPIPKEPETVKMTVAEISKALRKKIEIVE